MERMSFIPGPQASEQIFNSQGHLFFSRQTAIDFANEFVMKAPGGCSTPRLATCYQTMKACLSEGDQVDIWFGLRDPDPAIGQDELPSGELVGHTWAVVKPALGKERSLWEVGRRTPPAGEVHAIRAFNAYREAMAKHLGHDAPKPLPVDEKAAKFTEEFHTTPTISRALSPSNLYFASNRMWYLVDLCPGGDLGEPVILSRPMRCFDALVLSALMTLVSGRPPLVFGISNTKKGLGSLPRSYIRANYEKDETLHRGDDRPLLVL
ncbi:hypothetical protein HIM_07208 [Hirsutella minnesotensis 3608]|uniref:Uncharacterized protein n=1 Tax=Hirsutella minnesotensis 3608 TaxID=1043627 RepID=A0A0F8A4E0_9HYPO|nr:hypothetical protein HIM_07208 [Hirsutella minnesotensis 3608]